MKKQTEKQIKRRELLLRREQAKAKLIKIGVIDKPLVRFQNKYRDAYTYTDVRKLWYTKKTMTIDFIVKLEAFVTFCENNYE